MIYFNKNVSINNLKTRSNEVIRCCIRELLFYLICIRTVFIQKCSALYRCHLFWNFSSKTLIIYFTLALYTYNSNNTVLIKPNRFCITREYLLYVNSNYC